MPERFADLHLECGCADWLKPCNHLVAAWLRFGRDFESNPFLLFQLRGMDRNELLAFLRGGGTAAAVPEAEPETDDSIEEVVPIRLQPLPSTPAEFWGVPALPDVSAGAGERRTSDEDIFEKLGPAPFANWRAIEPQFHRVYDEVFEFALTLLKE
jgi:uncharacterized Zn finger protein